MKNSQFNRRSFLGSLALFSAGAALSSVISYVPTFSAKLNLETQWLQFFKINGGTVTVLDSPHKRDLLLPVSGHQYKAGEAVYFAKHNLLAVPTWIYWKQGNATPDDVVITFYDGKNSNQKLICINRYELAAVEALQVSEKQNDPIALLINKSNHLPPNAKEFFGKTTILKNQKVRITSALSTHDGILKQNFIYNV